MYIKKCNKKAIQRLTCVSYYDGNGRMSRLLTALLLYRSGYVVGKYISIENKIAKNKELYYKALEECQEGWHENKEDVIPFVFSLVFKATRLGAIDRKSTPKFFK